MANDGITVNGDYTIQTGGSITIQAAGDYLTLNAMASVPTGGGVLALNGDSAVTLSCGSGSVYLGQPPEGDPAVVVSAGTSGAVLVTAGTPSQAGSVGVSPSQVGMVQGAPAVGPRVVLADSATLTLAVGPEGAGASIEMTPASITIKLAEWSLSLTPAGISLTVGPSTLTVAPDQIGLNAMMINIEGVTQTALKGLATQINGTATVQVQGGLITLG